MKDQKRVCITVHTDGDLITVARGIQSTGNDVSNMGILGKIHVQ